jgi:hypothetical protein
MEAEPVDLVSHQTRANWTREEPKSENAWLIQKIKKGFFQLLKIFSACMSLISFAL